MTTQSFRLKLARIQVLKLKNDVRFPVSIDVGEFLTLAKSNGRYAFGIDYTLIGVGTLSDPTSAYVVVIDESVNPPVYKLVSLSDLTSTKKVRIITTAGPQSALASDDVLIIKQTVGAAFTLNVDWSARTKPLKVVDGKGDAATNNITIVPATGQSQLAVVNGTYIIDGNGGNVVLTPLPDGTGAY